MSLETRLERLERRWDERIDDHAIDYRGPLLARLEELAERQRARGHEVTPATVAAASLIELVPALADRLGCDLLAGCGAMWRLVQQHGHGEARRIIGGVLTAPSGG